MAAASVLLLPFDWLAGAVAAAAVHELSHIAALSLFGVSIADIQIGCTGAKISTGVMTCLQELVCAAAGPAGSLLLLFFIHRLPLLALFGGAQGIFNLIPIYPFDGGRILQSIFMLAKKGH